MVLLWLPQLPRSKLDTGWAEAATGATFPLRRAHGVRVPGVHTAGRRVGGGDTLSPSLVRTSLPTTPFGATISPGFRSVGVSYSPPPSNSSIPGFPQLVSVPVRRIYVPAAAEDTGRTEYRSITALTSAPSSSTTAERLR